MIFGGKSVIVEANCMVVLGAILAMKKGKTDPSLIYCKKYNISYPMFTDVLIDRARMIHRLMLSPCPVRECDGTDIHGNRCPNRIAPPEVEKQN